MLFRTQHRVTKSFRFLLPYVVDIRKGRDVLHHFQEILFPALFQVKFQFRRVVEVVLDGTFSPACDNQYVIDTRGDRLLDNVLDDWPVDEGEHLFRHRFRRGEEPGAEARGRDNSLFDFHHQHTPS